MNNKNSILLVLAGGAMFVASVFVLAQGRPRRHTVEKHLLPQEKQVVLQRENVARNLSHLRSLPPREKARIHRNYARLHRLPEPERRRIIKSYVEWLKYNQEEQIKVRQKYEELARLFPPR